MTLTTRCGTAESPVSWRAGGLVEKATTEAEALLVNVRRALRRAQAKAAELAAASIHNAAARRRRGRLRRAVNDLTDLWTRPRGPLRRPANRRSGTTPDGATRRVSQHDGDARPTRTAHQGNRLTTFR